MITISARKQLLCWGYFYVFRVEKVSLHDSELFWFEEQILFVLVSNS